MDIQNAHRAVKCTLIIVPAERARRRGGTSADTRRALDACPPANQFIDSRPLRTQSL
jgi:hypothetical protein